MKLKEAIEATDKGLFWMEEIKSQKKLKKYSEFALAFSIPTEIDHFKAFAHQYLEIIYKNYQKQLIKNKQLQDKINSLKHNKPLDLTGNKTLPVSQL